MTYFAYTDVFDVGIVYYGEFNRHLINILNAPGGFIHGPLKKKSHDCEVKSGYLNSWNLNDFLSAVPVDKALEWTRVSAKMII